MTKTKVTPVLLLADYWGEEGRHKAGTIIELPVPDAKSLISAGKAERADPMPGEGS